jgi:hypothetical protein
MYFACWMEDNENLLFCYRFNRNPMYALMEPTFIMQKQEYENFETI